LFSSEDRRRSGPGRKSNAEHAIGFYEYVLDLNREGGYEDEGKAKAKDDDEVDDDEEEADDDDDAIGGTTSGHDGDDDDEKRATNNKKKKKKKKSKSKNKRNKKRKKVTEPPVKRGRGESTRLVFLLFQSLTLCQLKREPGGERQMLTKIIVLSTF
jgi:hypothetical protein